MTIHRFLKAAFVLLFLPVLFSPGVRADPSSVRLAVPARAEPGAEITIRVRVTHEGNNFFHFTDWVTLEADEKEIKRWAFTADNRPEAENFSRALTYAVRGPTVFRARANCNLHGSAGPAEALVQLGATAAVKIPAKVPGKSPAAPQGRRGLGRVVLVLGIANLCLVGFQVASGRRWIPVKIPVHRRTGQVLAVLAVVHAMLALLLSGRFF